VSLIISIITLEFYM